MWHGSLWRPFIGLNWNKLLVTCCCYQNCCHVKKILWEKVLTFPDLTDRVYKKQAISICSFLILSESLSALSDARCQCCWHCQHFLRIQKQFTVTSEVRSNRESMTEKMYFEIVPFWSLGMHTICKFLHDDASCHIGHSICGDSSWHGNVPLMFDICTFPGHIVLKYNVILYSLIYYGCSDHVM